MTDVHLLSSRYHQLTMERFHAMVVGPEFSRLQGLWLDAIGRGTRFENLDDWVDEEWQWQIRDPASWDALQLDVTGLSQAYGITRWHVLWSLFVRDYDPTLQKLVAHPDFLSLRKKCLEAFGLRSPFPNSDVFRRWHCQDPGRVPKVWKALKASGALGLLPNRVRLRFPNNYPLSHHPRLIPESRVTVPALARPLAVTGKVLVATNAVEGIGPR